MQQVSLLDDRAGRRSSPAEPGAKAKDIRIDAILDPDHAADRRRDGGRLQQVVWNLLSNAISSPTKGGRIQVVLQRVNSSIALSVSDTGIGIAAELSSARVRPLLRATASTTRSFGGLGLGLAISKQLVELHGGHDPRQQPGRGRRRHLSFVRASARRAPPARGDRRAGSAA